MRDTRDESEGPRVPLKTILQNFLNHVENLEARVREGDDAYEKEFLVRPNYCLYLKCRSIDQTIFILQSFHFCVSFNEENMECGDKQSF